MVICYLWVQLAIGFVSLLKCAKDQRSGRDEMRSISINTPLSYLEVVTSFSTEP